MYTKLGGTKNDWTSCITNLVFARILLYYSARSSSGEECCPPVVDPYTLIALLGGKICSRSLYINSSPWRYNL